MDTWMVTFAFNPITAVMLIIFRPPKKRSHMFHFPRPVTIGFGVCPPIFFFFFGEKNLFFHPKKKKIQWGHSSGFDGLCHSTNQFFAMRQIKCAAASFDCFPSRISFDLRFPFFLPKKSESA